MFLKFGYCYMYLHTCTVNVWCYCRFRRQHEQLRQVIVRVLRPTTTKPTQAGTPGQEEADVKVVKPLVDEVADANAIEVCIYTQWGNLSQERIYKS